MSHIAKPGRFGATIHEPMRIAIATSSDYADLPDDEQVVLPALAEAGLRAEPAVWDDPSMDWSAFAVVVVRSTWDYHHQADAFLAWLERVSRVTRVLNPLALVRWNMDKRYLLELAALGVDTVPTCLVDRGSRASLPSLREQVGADALVIKPTVDASGDRAWRSDRMMDDDAVQARIEAESRGHHLLVQPLVRSIFDRGETSLMFFDGRYSHAVVKRAGDGEFRIHEERGGRVASSQPPASTIAWGERTLERVTGLGLGAPLFARVDVVESEHGPWLMEIELIEPEVYFRFDPAAAGRYARALADRVAAATLRADPPHPR